MSDRVSDAELERMTPVGDGRYVSVRADRWAAVIDELKERRARDLTAEEREELRILTADLKRAEDELAKYRENAPLVRLVQMLGLGEPVRPDIHALVRRKLEKAETERDAAIRERDEARALAEQRRLERDNALRAGAHLQPLRTVLRSWDWQAIESDGALPRHDVPCEEQVIRAFAAVERAEREATKGKP